ncbi:MAG: hypothetical protein J0H06_00365 [Actinobacteria bacterium]|nr:hypothetical protein [Actinomycetota bacterium]OJU85805.1 MAG: hypothetical protein BGO11_03705 [Solirubrobacterales bacterium 70-9]
MKTWSVTSRRSLAVLSAAALCAALLLSISVGDAAGAGTKCPPKNEAAGCTLPVEARFYKNYGGSSAITVQVSEKGFSLTVYAVEIKCTKYAPMLGPKQELAFGLSDKRHPKVGKSYTIKKTETQGGEEDEEPQHSQLEATLTFKSAKLVVVKIHLLNSSSSEVSCDGNGTYNVKRQS